VPANGGSAGVMSLPWLKIPRMGLHSEAEHVNKPNVVLATTRTGLDVIHLFTGIVSRNCNIDEH